MFLGILLLCLIASISSSSNSSLAAVNNNKAATTNSSSSSLLADRETSTPDISLKMAAGSSGLKSENLPKTTDLRMAALEQKLASLQTVLQDVLGEEKAGLAGMRDLAELRREVQQLKSEVRADGGGRTEAADNEAMRNRAVVEQWVQQSVVDLRQEVREVERRMEEEGTEDERVRQVEEREEAAERRLGSLEAVLATSQVCKICRVHCTLFRCDKRIVLRKSVTWTK
jgi:hypothetical protein